MELVREGLNKYRLKGSGQMRVDGFVYVNDYLLPLVRKDKSLRQLANAASLPGVVGQVSGMPDIHEGFGLPIGGVMATSAGGVISAGAVGMDINCGVRLLRTNVPAGELDVRFLRRLIDRYQGDTGLALAAYFTGEEISPEAGISSLPRETQEFVTLVFTVAAANAGRQPQQFKGELFTEIARLWQNGTNKTTSKRG